MDRRMTVTWTSPPPVSVDEELVIDDDWAWLVVRRPRQGTGAVGTSRARPTDTDRAALLASGPGPMVIDIHHPSTDEQAELRAVAERVAAACRESPVAVVGFAVSVTDVGADGSIGLALLAGADGTEPTLFQVRPEESAVRLEGTSGPLASRPMPPPATGFVSAMAEGVDGVTVEAELDPGVPVGTTLRVPDVAGATSVRIEVAGLLRSALPDEDEPGRFAVRTNAVTIPR